MGKYLAYLRTSTDKQDLNNQKMEVLEYANRKGIKIDDFIAISVSSRRTQRARRIDELLEKLNSGDTLLVTELSRLGRSTGEVIDLIDNLIQADIRIIVLKQNLVLNKEQDDIQALTMITLLSLFAQMERMMISRRTKEALAAKKAQGIQLGKPKGTIQSSVYDKDKGRINNLIQMGISVRKISTLHLDYGSPSSLHYYIQTRNLRPENDLI
ncbi:MAG: DNA invertase Pin-like site-specific DNA recombinase [Candidatus Promineifilaceae bacterium]|jgi:DNA invertase Pin-like site-specific DNA recombinase